MKKIVFKELELTNFKNHESLSFEYSEETAITAANGKGKTGIGEAVTWLLYGIDTSGAKLDPTPLNKSGNAKVKLLLSVDGKNLLLEKELGKSAKYVINEVPEKATKFDSIVSGLFDKNLFMTIYSPTYFPNQHWQEQRKQLLQYVSDPLDSEVLETLNKLDAERLTEKLKTMVLEDIEKVYKPKIKSSETQYERAAERFLTLKEQHENAKSGLKEVDAEKITTEMERIKQEATTAKGKNELLQKEQSKYKQFNEKLKSIKSEVDKVSASVKRMIDEPIKDTCDTCGQGLQDEALETVKKHKEDRINDAKLNGSSLVKQFRELKEKLDAMPVLDDYQLIDVSDLQEKYFQLQSDLSAAGRVEDLGKQVKVAEESKESLRHELGEARGICESIKKFNTKKAELMVEKINDLLTTLSVKLFNTTKDGVINPTFEIELDGKPYSKLSTAEKIKAGLELAEVFINQSKISIPVFVDNAESILKFTAPNAQLITAKVKAGELKIEAKGAGK